MSTNEAEGEHVRLFWEPLGTEKCTFGTKPTSIKNFISNSNMESV